MAKKSAASAKVIKPQFEKKTAEENFKEWKEVELFTLDANIEQSKRVDVWVNMRADYKDFTDETPTIEKVNELCAYATKCLEEVRAKIEALSFETVAAEDYEDIFEDMIVRPADCDTIEDFFKAWNRYGIVKSYAVKVFDVRRAIKNDGAAK